MSQFSFPQFGQEYDHYKMRALVDQLERQFRNIQAGGSASIGGSGGEHNSLTGRSANDAHPIGAITGLDVELLALSDGVIANSINISSIEATLNLHTADSTIHFTSASLSSDYLLLDATNGPLLGTLGTRALVPSIASNYTIGQEDNNYFDVWTDNIKCLQELPDAGGVTTSNINVESSVVAGSLIAVGVGAVSRMTINPAYAVMFGAVCWSAAGQTCIVEITGTSGTNFGSSLSFLTASPVTAKITVAGSGNVNFGSALPQSTGDATILLNGNAVINNGTIQGGGGDIIMSGNTGLNLGSVDTGAITMTGNHLFNIGHVDTDSTITIGGNFNVNNSRLTDNAVLELTGDDNFNAGSVDGASSRVRITGDKNINLSPVDLAGDILISGDKNINMGSVSSSGQIIMSGNTSVNLAQSNGTGSLIDIQGAGSFNLGSAAGGSTITFGLFAGACINTMRATNGAAISLPNSSTFLQGTLDGIGTTYIATTRDTFCRGFIRGGSTVTQSGAGCFASISMANGILAQSGEVSFINASMGLTRTFTISGKAAFVVGSLNQDITVSGVANFLLASIDDATLATNISGDANMAVYHVGAGSYGKIDAGVASAANLILAHFNGAGSGATGRVVTVNGNASIIAVDLLAGTPSATCTGDGSLLIMSSATFGGVFADNAWQFGQGLLFTANAMQIGAAGIGIAFRGVAAPFGTLGNGQIWNMGAAGISIRSNGVTLTLLQISSFTQTFSATSTTHSARLAVTPAVITGYTAHATGGVAVTSNAATDLDTTTTALATLVTEVTALRVVVENLRQDQVDTAEVLNQVIDDFQANNFFG